MNIRCTNAHNALHVRVRAPTHVRTRPFTRPYGGRGHVKEFQALSSRATGISARLKIVAAEDIPELAAVVNNPCAACCMPERGLPREFAEALRRDDGLLYLHAHEVM